MNRLFFFVGLLMILNTTNEIKLEFPDVPNARWVALRLLEGDQSIIDAIRSGELGNLKKAETIVETA